MKHTHATTNIRFPTADREADGPPMQRSYQAKLSHEATIYTIVINGGAGDEIENKDKRAAKEDLEANNTFPRNINSVRCILRRNFAEPKIKES